MLLSLMTISVAGVIVSEVTTVSTGERSVSQMNIDSMLSQLVGLIETFPTLRTLVLFLIIRHVSFLHVLFHLLHKGTTDCTRLFGFVGRQMGLKRII